MWFAVQRGGVDWKFIKKKFNDFDKFNQEQHEDVN